MTETEIAAMRDGLWQSFAEAARRDGKRIKEVNERSMSFGGVTMKYGMKIIGEPGENGLYPLYIALHGGGQDETGEINESQWNHMAVYYLDEIESGIYINPRAVRDTWDCHSNPESFPLCDRLIENMILLCGADPNRIYLLGFSAGGDGVYQISPRMADRFAAFNMSAGHPNGIELDSLYNTPIQLQVGQNDISYGRNTVTPEYGVKLSGLSKKYGGGYEHRVNIHLDRGHNFADYDGKEHLIAAEPDLFDGKSSVTPVSARTGAVSFLRRHVRNPLPDTVVWNLGVRAGMRDVDSFYWLSAPNTVNDGVIKAVCERESNSVVIETDGRVSGDFSVLLSSRMLDLGSDVRITVDGETYDYTPKPDIGIMEKTLAERCDPDYIFEDEVPLSRLRSL